MDANARNDSRNVEKQFEGDAAQKNALGMNRRTTGVGCAVGVLNLFAALRLDGFPTLPDITNPSRCITFLTGYGSLPAARFDGRVLVATPERRSESASLFPTHLWQYPLIEQLHR
jgi:hypothetical protein